MTEQTKRLDFSAALAREIETAEDTGHSALARQLRAAANAVTAIDAGHASTAVRELTADMVRAHGPDIVLDKANFRVVSEILERCLNGGIAVFPDPDVKCVLDN